MFRAHGGDPPGIVDDYEDLQDLESRRRLRWEVDGPGFMKRVPGECQPDLGRSSRRIGLDHVFPNGTGRTRETERPD